MRQKRKAKTLDFLLIGGFSLSEAGHTSPSILLARGNGYHEEIVRTLQTFKAGTKYKVVTERAKELSAELGITLGRNFSNDEWLGPEYK